MKKIISEFGFIKDFEKTIKEFKIYKTKMVIKFNNGCVMKIYNNGKIIIT